MKICDKYYLYATLCFTSLRGACVRVVMFLRMRIFYYLHPCMYVCTLCVHSKRRRQSANFAKSRNYHIYEAEIFHIPSGCRLRGSPPFYRRSINRKLFSWRHPETASRISSHYLSARRQRATVFDETTPDPYALFCRRSIKFSNARHTLAMGTRRYLLDRSSEIFGVASLEIYCVDLAQLTSKIDIGGYLWKNVTKVEINLASSHEKFSRVSEKSFLRTRVYIYFIQHRTPFFSMVSNESYLHRDHLKRAIVRRKLYNRELFLEFSEQTRSSGRYRYLDSAR